MTEELECSYMLYNTCYGGYGLSKAAEEELKKRMTEEEYKEFEYREHTIDNRTHPKVIELYMEKGQKWMADAYSRLSKFIYPLKYKKYIEIREYDGLESCTVDFVRAYNDLIQNFLKHHDENPELTVLDLKKEIAQLETDKRAYRERRFGEDKHRSDLDSDSD